MQIVTKDGVRNVNANLLEGIDWLDANGNVVCNEATAPASVTNGLFIKNGADATAGVDGVSGLMSKDVGGKAELHAVDEDANQTAISPHAFPKGIEPSHPMAWSYYSENYKRGKVFVDMLKLAWLVENMSGVKLVHLWDALENPIELPKRRWYHRLLDKVFRRDPADLLKSRL
jgi:hypothetical protein